MAPPLAARACDDLPARPRQQRFRAPGKKQPGDPARGDPGSASCRDTRTISSKRRDRNGKAHLAERPPVAPVDLGKRTDRRTRPEAGAGDGTLRMKVFGLLRGALGGSATIV